MITLGQYVVNPAHIAGYQIEGASIFVFMAGPFFNNGNTTIPVTCDSPSEAAAIAEEIRERVDGSASFPR